MNELKSFITNYQKTHNLTRASFIQKVGYKNITKGLRVLDAFIESPTNNTFKIRLCKQLGISIESMDEVVKKQMAIVNKHYIKNFTPHIRVKWTRCPSLLMTAQGAQHLYEIDISDALLKLPIDKQLEEVCHLYKRHQLDCYAETFNLKSSMENYAELVSIIESKLKEGIDIGWSIGNGFTYYKAFNESYQFNRSCKKINCLSNHEISEASWNYITNEIFVNNDPDVIGY